MYKCPQPLQNVSTLWPGHWSNRGLRWGRHIEPLPTDRRVSNMQFWHYILVSLDSAKKNVETPQKDMQGKPNGFAFPGRFCVFWCTSDFIILFLSLCCRSILNWEHVGSTTIFSKLRFVHQLRLLLSAIMGSQDGLVVAFGLICSTFISMSRGSTFRSYFLPEGDQHAKSVKASNCLAARNGLGLKCRV